MTRPTPADLLPDDPTMVDLIVRGKSRLIVLPFPGSLRMRDGLMLVGGLLGVHAIQRMGDPDLVLLSGGAFTIAVLGMMISALAQYRDWRAARNEGYVPVALQGLNLGHAAGSDLLLLLGILITSRAVKPLPSGMGI